jgi:serine protease
MRRFSVVSLVLAASLILSLAAAVPVNAGQGEEKIRVMIQFAAGQRASVENSLRDVGAEFHYTFDDLQTFVVTVPSAALNGLQRNPRVVLIEEDVERYPISVMNSLGNPFPAEPGRALRH